MSSSEERVGGVEPETVRLYRWRYEDWRTSWRCERRLPLWPGGTEETAEFVPLSALRLVEEELRQVRKLWGDAEGAANFARHEQRVAETELRQAREVAHSRLRDRARLVRRAERAEADLDLLIRRFALVSARSGMRAQALQLAEDCITENVANGEGVDSQPAVLDAIFDALKYEIADEPDGARPGAKSPIQSTDALSPVQGEHEQDGEDAEERYDRMMRERGFVSAADLCDPDWDERPDDDSEATR